MEVLVEFDYAADETDELTIHKGDVIKQVSQFEEGWFIGTLNGKVGVFPDNFVKIISKPAESTTSNKQKNNEDSSANKQSSDVQKSELIGPKVPMGIGLGNIFNGQPIQLMQTGIRDAKRNNGTNNKEHTEMNTPDPKPKEELTGRERVRTRFEYEPKQPDELHLHVDDVIVVIDKNLPDEGWWKGFNVNTGHTGLFPDNFVEVMATDEYTNKQPWKNTASPASKVNTSHEPPKVASKPITNGNGPLRYPGAGSQQSSFSNSLSDNPRSIPNMTKSAPQALMDSPAAHDTDDIPAASVTHADSGNPTNDQRTTPLTTERPKQIGKRLPSKVSNVTNPVPTRPLSETMEFSKFDDQNNDPLASTVPPITYNGAKSGGSQLTVNLSNGLANGPAGDGSYLKRSVSGTFPHSSSVNGFQVKSLQQQLDLVKEQNAQLRVDMHRIQKLLNDRVQSLMLELDEIKKVRAGDAVEISRLRQLVMQMDTQVLLGNDRIVSANGESMCVGGISR